MPHRLHPCRPARMPRTATKSSTLHSSPATAPHSSQAQGHPPCPHGPGHLPRAHRGLPLARSKLGFGTAMPLSNNLDKIIKDGEMRHWLISSYSKQILGCCTATDTRGYLRNKVASVAVGRCAVTEMRCSFAALFAQDCALPGDALLWLHPCRTGSA